MSESLYTLTEAAQHERMTYCWNYGHSWTFIQSALARVPVAMVCECGARASITVEFEPELPSGRIKGST
jgi:hypothetical protein